MYRRLGLLGVAVLLILGCSGRHHSRSCMADTVPADPERDAVVAGNQAFAFDLYQRVRGTGGNVFFSPYSISTALTMTSAGARGETERQMAEVLRLPFGRERLHTAYAALLKTTKTPEGKDACRLHTANSLWGQERYEFLDSFTGVLDQRYGAPLRKVDFAGRTEQTRAEINKWVAEQTREMIQELLQCGDLDPDVVLALVNAIYFKADWQRQFDEKATEDGAFRISADKTVTVPMMQQSAEFPFAQLDELSVLELPYDGERLSMIVLLPKAADGLESLEKTLDREHLARWLERLRPQTVSVSLPRFELDCRFDLSKTLVEMGMKDAFDGAQADFSGMTGQRDLFISLVVHQARVTVNEEGTEAAAATAVVMKRAALPAQFRADRPFVFLIRDKATGSILFLGRVVDPR